MLKDLVQIGNITKHENDPVFEPRPRILLANGVSLSVQASKYHYCSPRKDLPFDQYESFEIGFPSERILELDEYGGDDGVFAYVPKSVLLSIVEKAGGVIGLAND